MGLDTDYHLDGLKLFSGWTCLPGEEIARATSDPFDGRRIDYNAQINDIEYIVDKAVL